jgi:CubicO group peptidase (beta-lactamase class C family)
MEVMVTSLPRSTPEAEGIHSPAILDFIEAANREFDSLHSMMLLCNGKVVAEGWWQPYSAALPHMMYSVSKSFTSTAIGLAIDEGLLGLDSLVVDLLPDDLPPEIDPHLAALTVRHLLTMTTGHATDTVALANLSPSGNWARDILTQPLTFAPGTLFVYNSGATYLLAAILHRLTGERLLDYLTPRLFEPLGITDATWESCPRGIDAGGWGLSITTEDLAVFGQLLLQRGSWNGRQLVPAEWIDEATALQVDTSEADHGIDGRQGYGYQFWRCRPDGSYRADGAFAQLCIVLPEQDAVIVFTSGIPEAAPLLDLVWQHLLPAFGDHALDPVAFEMPSLGMKSVDAAAPPRMLSAVFESPNVSFAGVDADALTLTRDGVSERIRYGAGEWMPTPDLHVAATGAWTSPGTFTARIAHTGTPYLETIELTVAGDVVTLDIRRNVGFDSVPHLRATGSAAVRMP